MDDSYPKNLCIIPFVHITSKPNGACRLCCFSTKYIENKKGEQLFLGKNSFEEIWNSWDMRNIRKKMLNNKKLPECQHCFNEEKHNKASKRMKENKRFLKDYKHYLKLAKEKDGFISHSPSYLDLRLGNICNIKCRTCNPLFSSSWSKELKKNKKAFQKNSFLKNSYQQDFLNSEKNTKWYETEVFFDMLKTTAPDLKLIYISGGEPFLIKKHHDFIDHFIKTDTYKNIAVYINTNLTYLDLPLIKKLSHFKKAHFGVSIDAYEDKNDWIRSPSRFSKIKKYMEKLLQQPGNIEVSINCTVSVYNILYLSELVRWSRQLKQKHSKKSIHISFDLLHKPLFQQISILPSNLKKKAIERLNFLKDREKLFPKELEDIKSLIDQLKFFLEDDEEILKLRKQLKEHIIVFDKWRQENFVSIFPEFKGYKEW